LHHVLVGRRTGDPYEQRILALAEEAGVADRLHLVGNVGEDELVDLMQRAQVFLHTPVTAADGGFEGFGIVYLEAAACGTPAIGTLDQGAEDAIVQGVTGLLVPQERGAVAAALRTLLADGTLRARFAAAGAPPRRGVLVGRQRATGLRALPRVGRCFGFCCGSWPLMRVLFLVEVGDPGVGSSTRQAFQHAAELRRLGHEAAIVATVRARGEATPTRVLGTPVFRLHSDYPVRFRAWRSLHNKVIDRPLEAVLARVAAGRRACAPRPHAHRVPRADGRRAGSVRASCSPRTT
jgi:hypothetical protein